MVASPGPAQLLHAERKARDQRPDHEIDHRRAEQEEYRRREQVRQKRLALVAVEAGRHEHVDLRGDHRERDEDAAEHRELELHDEIFKQPGVDEFRIGSARDPDVRPGQHVVDLLGEEEADDHGDEKGRERLDQPRAQLDQVIHQRRLGRLNLLLFVVAGRHPVRPVPSSSLASAGLVASAAAAVSIARAGSVCASG